MGGEAVVNEPQCVDGVIIADDAARVQHRQAKISNAHIKLEFK